MSLPMPLAAPVTIADLSLSFMPISCFMNGLLDAECESLTGEIEHADAAFDLARLPPRQMRAGAPHVLQPGIPELAHRRPRELVVLRARRMREAPIDQMRDRDLAPVVAQRLQSLVVGIVAKLCGQLFHEAAECVAELLQFLDAGGVEPRLARVLNVLGTLEDLIQIDGKLAARAEEVDLHDQRADLRRIVEDVPQRGVGHDTAIPIVSALDDNRRKPGRQRAARHDVLGLDLLCLIVEIDRVAGVKIHGANAHADAGLAVEQAEIDQLLERLLEGRGIVDAQRLRRPIRSEEHRRHARHEETGNAEGRSGSGAEPVERDAHGIELSRRHQRNSGGDAVPELAQALEPFLRRVTGDERGVDRADRHAGHPVRGEAVLGHALVDACLVRAERASTLQHENAMVVLDALGNASHFGTPRRHGRVSRSGYSCSATPKSFSFSWYNRSRSSAAFSNSRFFAASSISRSMRLSSRSRSLSGIASYRACACAALSSLRSSSMSYTPSMMSLMRFCTPLGVMPRRSLYASCLFRRRSVSPIAPFIESVILSA